MRSPQPEVLIMSRCACARDAAAFCEEQERRVQEHLARIGVDHGAAIVLRDAGQSGTDKSRPGYKTIVEMVETGKDILLAVSDLSRLSRRVDVVELIRDIVVAGGRVITVDGGIDTELPGWELHVITGTSCAPTVTDLGHREEVHDE